MVSFLVDNWPTLLIGAFLIAIGGMRRQRTALVVGAVLLLEAMLPVRFLLLAVILVEWVKSYREYIKGRSREG